MFFSYDDCLLRGKFQSSARTKFGSPRRLTGPAFTFGDAFQRDNEENVWGIDLDLFGQPVLEIKILISEVRRRPKRCYLRMTVRKADKEF